MPGEYYATTRDMLLVTVLGSCVAACMRDRISGIGGMNHFMLPDSDNDPHNPAQHLGALRHLRDGNADQPLLKLGARRDNLEAKVFGGGNVLRGFTWPMSASAMPISCWIFCRPKTSRSSPRICSTSTRARYIISPRPAGAGQKAEERSQQHHRRTREGLRVSPGLLQGGRRCGIVLQ